MRCFSLMLGFSVGLAAQAVRLEPKPDITHSDNLHPDIKKGQDGSWVRSQSGGGEAAPAARLQISSQVRVVLRGSPANRITFQLTQRVWAKTVEEAARRLAGSAPIDPAKLSELYAEEAARMLAGRASLTTSGGTTFISVQGLRSYATLELYVPRQVKTASLEIPRGGDIEIYNYAGSVVARTPSGDIQADNVGGELSANTGGGHIRLGKIDGAVTCYSGGGSITVGDAGADVTCQTVGGEILVTRAQGPVRLSSGGGNITVERAAQRVEVHSMRGAIQVGHAGGAVIADTRGGEIRVG
jgi:hypothetical protein